MLVLDPRTYIYKYMDLRRVQSIQVYVNHATGRDGLILPKFLPGVEVRVGGDDRNVLILILQSQV